jgi:hypothetical protein
MLMQPGLEHVLLCFPEMITPQDGSEKQDCERNAAKRWVDARLPLFAPYSITLLGDDLFCNQPLCEQIIARKQYFIFVCKPDSHVELYRIGDISPDELNARSLPYWLAMEVWFNVHFLKHGRKG